MSNRTPILISVAIVVAMVAASFWAWTILPSGTEIPVHFDIHGNPNGFAKAPLGLFLMPVIAALIGLLFAALPTIEPRRLNLAHSAKFYHASWIGIVLLMAATHAMILYSATHHSAPGGVIIIVGLCLLIIVIGNYLGKTRSMFLGGIRTPWSLTSEYSWQRTHSLAGKLFMLSGIAGFVATFMFSSAAALGILLSTLFVAIGISIAMSYVYWRHDPDRQTGDVSPG